MMIGGDPTRGRLVAGSRGFRAPILLDDGTLQRRFGVKSVPWTVVLRSDGHADTVLIGAQSRHAFAKAIAAAR